MKAKLRLSKAVLGLLVLASAFQACTEDPKDEAVVKPAADGVFVMNEGAFGKGNASLDLYSINAGSVTSNVFETNNSRPLGDVLQSGIINNGKIYLIVNGSGNIEVLNASDLKVVKTITGIKSPRYMVIKGGLGYVSNWDRSNVIVLDLSTNTIKDSIAVGFGPEQMEIVNDNLYVTNSFENSISVVNLSTKAVTPLTTEDAPSAISTDSNGKLWVLCSGSYKGTYSDTTDDSYPYLMMIDPSSNTIAKKMKFSSKGNHPGKMVYDKKSNSAYVVDGSKLYAVNSTATSFPTSTAFTLSSEITYLYGISVDPNTGDIYIANASFTGPSKSFRYTSAGVLKGSFTTGVGTNGFLFQ